MLIHHGFDALASPFTDAAFIVQYTGNGGFPHATQAGDVFDSQPILHPVFPWYAAKDDKRVTLLIESSMGKVWFIHLILRAASALALFIHLPPGCNPNDSVYMFCLIAGGYYKAINAPNIMIYNL